MTSTIDRSQPAFRTPLASKVTRDNFGAAATDIEALQAGTAVIPPGTITLAEPWSMAGLGNSGMPRPSSDIG